MWGPDFNHQPWKRKVKFTWFFFFIKEGLKYNMENYWHSGVLCTRDQTCDVLYSWVFCVQKSISLVAKASPGLASSRQLSSVHTCISGSLVVVSLPHPKCFQYHFCGPYTKNSPSTKRHWELHFLPAKLNPSITYQKHLVCSAPHKHHLQNIPYMLSTTWVTKMGKSLLCPRGDW